MDGILSVINAVIPIVPDNQLLSDRGAEKGPPVEIAPIPDNSFMSDDMVAETLKNAYTLSLDIKGYEGEASSGSRNTEGAKAAVPAKAPSAESQLLQMDEAFMLSLGSGEETLLTSEGKREMLRLKNYEMLGKSGGRRIAGRYAEIKDGQENQQKQNRLQKNQTDAYKSHLPEENSEHISGRLEPREAELLTSVLSNVKDPLMTLQTGAERRGSVQTPPTPLADIPAGLMQDTPDALLPATPEEILQYVQSGMEPEEVLTGSITVQKEAVTLPKGLNIPEEMRQATSSNQLLQTGTNEVQINRPAPAPVLTASDGLRSDLQVSPSVDIEQGFNILGYDKNAQINTELPFNIQNATPVRVDRPSFSAIREAPNEQVGDLRTAVLIDLELSRITTGLFTGTNLSDAVQSAAGGSMLNLRKMKELPYALYIFGNVTEQARRDVLDEDNTAVEEDTTRKPKQQQQGLLRVAEAIRMASVLHQLYYGGEGRFDDEIPWYWPYVSYALKHGIIQVDDFSDFNGFATRAEAAYVFSRCVPEAEFPVLNHIPLLPDVTEDDDWGSRIYLLFRAGVLFGADGTGRFYPDRLITRTEAAAIIGRIATPADRKGFML